MPVEGGPEADQVAPSPAVDARRVRRARKQGLGIGVAAAGLVAAVLFSGSVAMGRGAGGDSTRGDGSERPPAAGENVPSTTAPPTTTPAPVTTERGPTTTTAPPPASTTRPFAEPASGQQAVTAFTAAVDRGDATTAWRLLSSRSRAFWRTKARFTASINELKAGSYGAWARSRNRTASSIVLASSGDGEILVVTMKGTTSDEGPARTRAQAFPVRHRKGIFRLELWDLGPGGTVPEVTGPGTVTDATVRTTDRTPTFTARAKGERVSWSVDGRDPTDTNVSGNQAGYRPEEPLSTGSHVLTVASVGPTWLTATAVVVQTRDPGR